jgi:uncharacterized protein YkuJ
MIRDIWLGFSGENDIDKPGWDGYFISQYYVQELRKERFIKFHRIIIDPQPEPNPLTVNGEDSGVCFVNIQYDIKQYHLLKSEKQKCLLILELHHRGMMALCDKLGWDKNIFIKIRDQLIERDFKIECILKKAKRNSAKEKVYAKVSLFLERESEKCCVSFERAGVELCSIQFFEAMPTFLYWSAFLIKHEYWESTNIFVVADWDKEIFFKCNYLTGQFEVVFDTAKRSKKQLEGKLKTWRKGTERLERIELHQKYWDDAVQDWIWKKVHGKRLTSKV